MAIDTANKRYSMIGFASPVTRVYPIPDGSDLDTAAERRHYIGLYSGITLQAQLATLPDALFTLAVATTRYTLAAETTRYTDATPIES